MMAKVIALLLAFSSVFLIRAQNDNWIACPFNEAECQCLVDPNLPVYQFDTALCKSITGKLPIFLVGATKWALLELEVHNADVSVLPADWLETFSHISGISFYNKPSSATPQRPQWDDNVFANVQYLQHLWIENVYGIIPFPKALNVRPGWYLVISKCPEAMEIGDNAFEGVPLFDLNFIDTDFAQISPKAFTNSKVTDIVIQNTDFRKVMPELGVSLKDLVIFGVSLENTSLTEVKQTDFTEEFAVSSLSYRFSRGIEGIGNPIVSVEKGSFRNVAISFALFIQHTELTKFDLAVFDGLLTVPQPGVDRVAVDLSYNNYLKNLTTSDTTKFPFAVTLSVMGSNVPDYDSGLENVDPAVGQLLDNVPDMKLNIMSNKNLKCEGLRWLAKMECPKRVYINNAFCADKNGQPLNEFLKTVDPNTKCGTASFAELTELDVQHKMPTKKAPMNTEVKRRWIKKMH